MSETCRSVAEENFELVFRRQLGVEEPKNELGVSDTFASAFPIVRRRSSVKARLL
jgi:hypothetical protein